MHTPLPVSPSDRSAIASTCGQAEGRDSRRELAQTGSLGWRAALAWAGGAIGGFHLMHSVEVLSWLSLAFLLSLAQLARLPTPRRAFYVGLAVGYACYAPQLSFFWTLFGAAAMVLWLVLAFWLGVFVLAAHACWRFGKFWLLALVLPVLWTAAEYFRSELYYLRFSWLSVGFAFWDAPRAVGALGSYGWAFLLMALASGVLVVQQLGGRKLAALAFGGALLAVVMFQLASAASAPRSAPEARRLEVAGVQLEFPGHTEVLVALDDLIARQPQAELLVLSEYTFDGPVPEAVKRWCRRHARYLIVGGKDPLPNGGFHNTAFVVAPTGEIVFKQVKAVPIQFFQDGLPAPTQRVWESPWGKLGLCVCYDLSYTRVTDELIRQGALALIVPTMDVAAWGRQQHALHARVAPIRAAEYRVPVFRVASSGISQCVDRTGRVVASAPFPGPGAVLAGTLTLGAPGRLPLDRWLAPACVGGGIVFCGWLALRRFRARQAPALGKVPPPQ